ncbi:amidohydrolase family protein [Maribellus comscasis]|uniref:Amidohydrolase family protein n=1 Tax=Maribellus comscasis TaxID=2681766 RepID=A0A6I6K6B5_9BACT|nr:amidohydrolase [Maribellus comscasis]QGY47193.1 amidohydrolase family protein [Maribellus comscasis]
MKRRIDIDNSINENSALDLMDDSAFADVVILNGKVLTIDENFAIAESIAIRGDRILKVGTQAEIRQLINIDTKVINVEGRTVIPGLIEAHLHPEQGALSELEEEIPVVKTINELLQWIIKQTEVKSENEWIIFPKFFYTRLKELRPPTLKELDEAAPINPVFLNGSFGGVINSAAMRISNITENTVDEGILKNPFSGQPTGILSRSAFKLLNTPPDKVYSEKEKATALAAMLKRYNRYGITSICSGAGDMQTFSLYQEIRKANELTCRVFLNIRFPLNLRHSVSVDEMLDSIDRMDMKTGDGDEWVKIGALKIILDGGILTGTAYLREPWGQRAQEVFGFEDPEYRGILNYNFEELERIVSKAAKSGWKFAAHCTGGGGVDLLLDVFEKINKTISLRDKRFAIIHGNFFTPESTIRMKKTGIYADAQAAWLYKDADAFTDIIGSERVSHFLPFRSMLDNEVMVNGGSDHMVKFDANSSVNPFNPFLGMWCMITRTTENSNVINSNEAITREEALRIYTINNAYATFEEAIKGSLETGKFADLAVLSSDILTCSTDQIKDIESVLTLVGGKVVFASDEIKMSNK